MSIKPLIIVIKPLRLIELLLLIEQSEDEIFFMAIENVKLTSGEVGSRQHI